MSEQLEPLAQDAIIAAFTDAEMTAPSGSPALFDPQMFDFAYGDGEGINNSNGQFTLPLTKIKVFIGEPYGNNVITTDDFTYTDSELWIPIQVMTNTLADQKDFQQRLGFAMKSRGYVFGLHGLQLTDGTLRARNLAYSTPLGLIGRLYTPRFWWGSSTST